LFNKNDKLRICYERLKAFYPQFDQEDIERSRLFKLLFPDEEWNEKKLRYLMSDLGKQLEEFLIWQEFQKDEFSRRKHLMQSYKLRKLDKYFSSAYKQTEKALQDQDRRDIEYHYRSFRLEEELFHFKSSRSSHQASTNLQEVVNKLDRYFLANKLKYSCEIINNRDVVHADYDLLLLDEIRNYLDQNPQTEHPAIQIYHQILLTLLDPDDKNHYQFLLDLLDVNRERFSREELFGMYIHAKNYCIIKINKGEIEYTRELFDFYRIILKNRIIFIDGFLTQWDFKNIVTLGLRLEEFDWTQEFMNQYRENLDPAYRDNVWSFNMANLEHHRGNYGRTLDLLQEVEFTDMYYHLDAKTLLLKTYYETAEWDSLQSLIDAFKVYLKRSKTLPSFYRTVYGNLVRFTQKLLRYRRGRKVDLDQLSQEIEECKEIANIPWLRAKLEAERSAQSRS
jgi:hypothetical protein